MATENEPNKPWSDVPLITKQAAYKENKDLDTVPRVFIRHCSACGKNHSIDFVPIPDCYSDSEGYTHYGFCEGIEVLKKRSGT